ncbi:MAG TPA: hypothetical protein VH309_00555 [Elusimicrobiota bacterium]|jgi:ribosome-binding protein aMBF1 (putative translation factor)|nr:hypothetical protein [Elusimicrobiota bacterium]
MTKKWMAVLALGLLAPAAFGQEIVSAPVMTLRSEIKRDKADMSGRTKAERAEHKQLVAQEKAELAAVAKTVGTRAEKKTARLAVRAKYASLLKEARAKAAYQRKNLREDIASKQQQIKKLRQS